GHGHRVGTRDCKDLMYLLCVVNLISGALHSNTFLCPKDAKKKTGKSKTARLQEAFAQHLRHVGRVYPQHKYPEVVLLIDNAPWHRGKAVNAALADNPHLRFKRLPSYSPQLNPIERFWKKLRRRATHNRLSTPWPTSRSPFAQASATSRPCVTRSSACSSNAPARPDKTTSPGTCIRTARAITSRNLGMRIR